MSAVVELSLCLNQASPSKLSLAPWGKCHTTIAREVKNRAVISNKGAPQRVTNRCIHRMGCMVTSLCKKSPYYCKHKRCCFCPSCNSVCPDFIEEHCEKLKSPPYVCNGCKDEFKCTLRKRYYIPTEAQKAYEKTLVESREGMNTTEEEIAVLDNFLSSLILKGQSINHIFANNSSDITVCQKTAYNLVNAGLITARRIDMPRSCRLRPRKRKAQERKVDQKCRIGRTYDDFQLSLKENPDIEVVQMDTLEGTRGGKVILTIHFVSTSFMLAFLRERNTARSVQDVFENLYSLLGKELFQRLFPVLLADNGSEFSDPTAIEYAPDSTQRTRIYYCDPAAPYQKGALENNHTLIRRILPKGTSFNDLNQEDITLLMNHVNSYSREKLANKTPYEALRFLHGQAVMDMLGAELISPNEVFLRPDLLKR